MGVGVGWGDENKVKEIHTLQLQHCPPPEEDTAADVPADEKKPETDDS